MPRPNKTQREVREKNQVENRRIVVEKIREKMLEKGEEKRRVIKGKIRIALGSSFLTYTDLLKASGVSPKIFKKYRKEMVDSNEIAQVIVNGKKGYCLSGIRNYESLEVFAVSVLHQRLTDIDEFNRLLGSLVAYTLRNYEIGQALSILRTVFYEVESYIKPPLPAHDQHLLLFGTPAVTQNAESKEWELWRDIDSRKYVTTVTVQGKDKLVSKEAFDLPRFQREWLNNSSINS